MQLIIRLKSYRAIGWAFLILALINVGAHAGWQPSLSESEIQALKLTVSGHSYSQRQVEKSSALEVELGVEVLLVELQELKSRTADSPRLAEVFVFDYAKTAANVLFVDVETNAVVGSRRIDHIHLPLNEREIAAASHWLTNDSALMSELSLEYEMHLAMPLMNLAQLHMKVSIWNPGTNQLNQHNCHQTRCALVSLFTKDHYNFSIEPVVNLATGNVYLNAVQ